MRRRDKEQFDCLNMLCTTNHTHAVRQQRRKELLKGADIDSANTNETVILVSVTSNKQETLQNILIYTYKTITTKRKSMSLAPKSRLHCLKMPLSSRMKLFAYFVWHIDVLVTFKFRLGCEFSFYYEM